MVPVATPALCLDRWLSNVVPTLALAWLAARVEMLAGGAAERDLFIAYSQAVRHVGRTPLVVAAADLADADAARRGWNPQGLTTDQAARARLLLALPDTGAAALNGTLDRLAASADLHELIALYRALPLLPHAPVHQGRAAEGIRSNMRAVYEAVALDNSYAAEQLDEGAWNQLVLKAIFVGSPLHRIIGLDARANPALSRMLVDYARERRSAGRPVAPALWRAAARHLPTDALAVAVQAFTLGDEREALGVAKALGDCLAVPEALRAQAATTPWEQLA